jgi:membrane fusion protein
MSQLFRSEAVAGQHSRLLGQVVLAQPLSFHALTLFLAGIVIAGTVFLSQGSYVRKETVHGFLSPDQGLVKVHAPRAGIVSELHVKDGMPVARGAPLLTLQGQRITGGGLAVDLQMLRALDVQLQEIENRKALERYRRDAEIKRLGGELLGLESERKAIGNQVRIQRLLLQSLQENDGRVRQLVHRGYVSDSEYAIRKEKLLENEQTLAGLLQRIVLNTNRARQTESLLEQVPLASDSHLSELNSLQAELTLRRTELEAQSSVSIIAPVAGTVTALRAIAGTSVDTRLPLLTILPEGAHLEAQLFVPSRAIGFVAIEQQVRLLYDAFDYRRFGVHVGTVSGISSAVFAPTEAPSGMQITEPSYRVTVRLQTQDFAAYGERFSLQSGMALRADIVLEQRSLLDWLLNPLISLRGRT